MRTCVVAYLTLRALAFAAALLAHAFPSLATQGVPGWPAPPVHPGWDGIFSAFERFDALWFLRVAEHGYRVGDGSAAFFPLFPLVTRALSVALGGHPLAAGTLVSNVAFVAALVATYRLAQESIGEGGARAATWFLCLFPTAYFFVMPYSESLFLMCVASSLLAARRGRWWLAGTAGALATLTRSVGIVLVPALLVEALQQRGEGRRSLAPFVAAASVAVGTASYALWWHVRAGDAAIPLVKQQLWQRSFSWPWDTLWDGTRIAIDRWGHAGGGYWLLDLAIAVPVIALSVFVVLRYRPAFGVYVWGSLIGPLLFVFPGRPLMSLPRFVVTLFPVTWVLADLTEGRPRARIAILTIGALVLVALCVLTVNWFYVF